MCFARRKPLRLNEYDYSSAGYYFVTICTQNKIDYFGYIENGQMILNEWGEIAQNHWINIPTHFKHCLLDQFIIMPNHVHGIVIIPNVGDADLRPLQDRTKMTLCKIIHGFKSSLTRTINQTTNTSNFKWQRSFYDHVIRNEKSLHEIREYIDNNAILDY